MATATVWQVPNLAQAVVDSTAGTLTYQTYDTATSAWVTQWTLTLATGLITLAADQSITGTLGVTGAVTLSDTLGVTGAVTLSDTLAVTGATTLSDTLGVTGAATLSSTLAVTDAVTADGFNPAVTVNSLAGTTAGTVYYVQPFAGSGYNKVLLWFDGYENDTTTAQTITYPTAFATAAGIPANTSGLTLSTSLTTLTITAPDATTPYTGFAVAEGW